MKLKSIRWKKSRFLYLSRSKFQISLSIIIVSDLYRSEDCGLFVVSIFVFWWKSLLARALPIRFQRRGRTENAGISTILTFVFTRITSFLRLAPDIRCQELAFANSLRILVQCHCNRACGETRNCIRGYQYVWFCLVSFTFLEGGYNVIPLLKRISGSKIGLFHSWLVWL